MKIINIVEDICTSIGILIKLLKLSTRVICIIVGVGSVAFAGQYSNHIVVTGDGIDVVELTKLLRKKVGSSELVSVGSLEYGGHGLIWQCADSSRGQGITLTKTRMDMGRVMGMSTGMHMDRVMVMRLRTKSCMPMDWIMGIRLGT